MNSGSELTLENMQIILFTRKEASITHHICVSVVRLILFISHFEEGWPPRTRPKRKSCPNVAIITSTEAMEFEITTNRTCATEAHD
jgi:hypothetical protein